MFVDTLRTRRISIRCSDFQFNLFNGAYTVTILICGMISSRKKTFWFFPRPIWVAGPHRRWTLFKSFSAFQKRLTHVISSGITVKTVLAWNMLTWIIETGHYCVMGPEDDEPHCGNPQNKNRSNNFEINPRTKIILNRIYQSGLQSTKTTSILCF